MSYSPATQGRAVALLITVIAGMALVSCNPAARPEGHYQGTLVQSSPSGATEQSVVMDVTYDKRGDGSISVRDEKTIPLLTILVPQAAAGGFSLKITGVLGQTASLQPDPAQTGCFRSGALDQPAAVEFCFDASRIYLEIGGTGTGPSLALSGNHFAVDPPLPFETPTAYTLSTAINSALSRNFGSRIEAEHYLEVKEAAKAAWQELLPHLSLSAVLSALPLSAAGLLGAIADLAPFALPSNWYQAEQASFQASAEKDALTLVRADLAAEMEGLVYALKRDEAVLDFYQGLRPKMQDVYQKVVALVRPGTGFDSGSPLQIETTLNAMDLDEEGLKLMIAQDKIAIAQALGLNNPDGVSEIELGPELVPIDSAHALNTDDLAPIALERSFELQQLDFLISTAKSQSHALWFNWLNPSEDLAIGPASGAQFAVNKEQVVELTTQREQRQQTIASEVGAAVTAYNSALTSYALSQERMNLQLERWAYEMSQLVPQSGLNTMDIESVEQDWVASAVQFQSIVTGFRVARSTLDRLLLQGFYLNVQK